MTRIWKLRKPDGTERTILIATDGISHAWARDEIAKLENRLDQYELGRKRSRVEDEQYKTGLQYRR